VAKFEKFEEYKLFVDDTARFSERRQTVSNIFVAVNSLLVAAIGLLVKDLGTSSPYILLGILPLATAGIAVSLWWRQLIRKYKQIVGQRIGVLREMENEIPESVRMYHLEDTLYPRDKDDKMIPNKGLNFSDLEARLPMLFLVLYCIFGIGSVIVLVVRLYLT